MKSASPSIQGESVHAFHPTREGYLPHDLARLMNALDLRLLEHLRVLKFSPQKYRVLQIVAELEPISVGEVARVAVIEHSVVSRMIDQLQVRKLVSKAKRRGNARVVDVRLTAEGREVANEIQPMAESIVKFATEILSADELTVLVKTLAKLYRRVTDPS